MTIKATRQPKPLRCMRKNMRGAFSILSVVILPLVILFSVLSLDAGRLYWEGSELQRIADLAALDAAQGSSTLFNYSENKPANNTSLNAELSTLTKLSKEQNLPRPDWNVTTVAQQRGIHTNASGIREACALDAATATPEIPVCNTGASYNVVEVVASKTVCLSIIANLKALFPDSDYSEPSSNDSCLTPGFTMSRTGYAAQPLYAAFSAGTTLLSISSDRSSLLAALLGLNAGIDVAGFNGLANADIPIPISALIEDPEIHLSAGTVDAVLSDTSINISELATIGLAALDSKAGSGNIKAALELLRQPGIEKLSIPLPLSGSEGILYVPSGLDPKGVLGTELSLGSLLNTAILLANKSHFIESQTIDLGIPGLLSTTIGKLEVIEAPQIAVGPVGCKTSSGGKCQVWNTEARTAQIKIEGLNLALKLGLGPLDLVNVAIGLNVSAGDGRARVVSAEKTTDSSYDVLINGSSNAVNVDNFLISATAGLGLVKATITNQGNKSTVSHASIDKSTTWWPGISPDLPTVEIMGNGDLLTPLLGKAKISVCIAVVLCLNNFPLMADLSPILDTTLNALLTPLGINFSTMEVRILDIKAGTPALVR